MEPRHPIAYFTMLEILTRVLALKDISKIQPVFLTGPDALKAGYTRAMMTLAKKEEEAEDGETDAKKEKSEDILAHGVHVGMWDKPVRKIVLNTKGRPQSDYIRTFAEEQHAVIEFWNEQTQRIENISRRERVNRLTHSEHWKKRIEKERENVPHESCWEHLYKIDNHHHHPDEMGFL